ncbi:hypothetical protein BGZ46_004454 [Entomortierella lignicola]|nr:hypothetical protein BGZ46_004454 [Entomortierella lignicola]
MGNSLCHSKDIDISDRNIVVAKASEKKEEVPKQEQQTSSNINATNDGKLSSKIEKVSHSSSFFLSSPDSPSISSNPSPTTVVEDNNTTNSNNVDHSNQNQQTPSIQSSGKSIVFSQSPTEGDKKNSLLNNLVSNNNKNLYQTIATGTTASSDIDTPSYSLEKMDEQTQVSVDYQWLEGRRYHNTPGASYLLPNDIDE